MFTINRDTFLQYKVQFRLIWNNKTKITTTITKMMMMLLINTIILTMHPEIYILLAIEMSIMKGRNHNTAKRRDTEVNIYLCINSSMVVYYKDSGSECNSSSSSSSNNNNSNNN